MRNEVLTRDDFAKLLFAGDFFAFNPAFSPVQPAITACDAAYKQSAAKSTCRCGGDSSLIFGCLDATIDLMEQFRATNPAALQTLVDYISMKRNKAGLTSFTLYYRKTSQEPLRKVKFP